MRNIVAPLALAAAMLAAPAPASATWMGLADGDYAVTLQCTFSSVIDCSQTIAGTITVSGSGLSAMDFDINGETFAGDPLDIVTDASLLETETSAITHAPLSFLSLRLITAGSTLNFQTGDHWWVYCNNINPVNCTPNTQGLWSARRVDSVSEPPTWAVAPLALAAALSAVRRRRRAAAPASPTAA